MINYRKGGNYLIGVKYKPNEATGSDGKFTSSNNI